jgi:hypothetical protein
LLVQVPSIAEDPAKWGPVLKRICWYVVLAPASSDQVTLLATTAADKKLLELPAYKELLQTFITKEVRREHDDPMPPDPGQCLGLPHAKRNGPHRFTVGLVCHVWVPWN